MAIQKLKKKLFGGASSSDTNKKSFFEKINEIIDWLNGIGQSGSGSYKKYVALMNQSGGNAPVAILLENTIGGSPSWIRNAQGDYSIIISDAFPDANKVVVIPGASGTPNSAVSFLIAVLDSSTIEFFSSDGNDGKMVNLPIEIRVYQ